MKRCLLLLLLVTLQTVTALAQRTEEDSDGTLVLNKNNLVIKEWITDVASNQKFLDHITVYNAEGKKVEETEYDMKGMQWRKRYEWGPNGKIARELVYDFRGRLDNIRKYEYNEYGRRKTESVYNPKGKLIKIKVYEYNIQK